MPSVLIVDDEITLSKNISKYLSKKGYECLCAGSGEEALERLGQFGPDVVLLDFTLPGKSGLDVLKEIRSTHPDLRIVFLTGHSSVKLAVEAMKSGADDYVNKPVSLQELKLVVDRVLGQHLLGMELDYYRKREAQESGLGQLLGNSGPLQSVRRTIERCLQAEARITRGAPAPVLITGETGTGKELVARAFHYDDTRRSHPFVEINCAAIPSQLMEAELFGYERGAFTGANQRKAGLVESAERGTLFLDEIGDMELDLQAKLLSLLENHRFRRVGGLRERGVDIRIIAATNQDLDRLVAERRFRQDLLYRLRVIHITLPPLRDRTSDAVMLAEQFVRQQCERYGRDPLILDGDVVDVIEAYPWPGNVRELRNVIENAVMLVQDEVVERRHIALPESIRGWADAPDGDVGSQSTLDQTEVRLLLEALGNSGWNITAAARDLGVSRDRLRYRIKKYRLERSHSSD